MHGSPSGVRMRRKAPIDAQLFNRLLNLRHVEGLTMHQSLLGFGSYSDAREHLNIFLSMLVGYIGTHAQTASFQIRTQLRMAAHAQLLGLKACYRQFPEDALEGAPASCCCACNCCDKKIPTSGMTCFCIWQRTACSIPARVVNCSGGVSS